MRRTLILAAVTVILGPVTANASLAGDAPSAAPPAPSAPAPKVALPRRKLDLGEGVSLELVLIPAGEFDMGSLPTEVGRGPNEVRRRVRIESPFWIATTELTWAALSAVTGVRDFIPAEPMEPLAGVSWNDFRFFLEDLNRRTPGGGFRLPAEVEWEYACRAGTTTTYSFGADTRELPLYACCEEDGANSPFPVGTLRPNPWGLHDMHGNVGEYCSDAWRDPPPNPGPEVVVRGGAWSDPAAMARSASRAGVRCDLPNALIGFRLARTAEGLDGSRCWTLDTRVPSSRTPEEWGAVTGLGIADAPFERQGGGGLMGLGGSSSLPALSSASAPVVSTSSPTTPPAWASVSPEQVRAAKAAGVPVAYENSIGMRFVLVPAGTFRMGSPRSEPGRQADETPHEVTLTRPYYLGVTEVTNGQYRRLWPQHHTGGDDQSLDADDQPVLGVSAGLASLFTAWLKRGDSQRDYRLPTEAEWEWACRAGRATPFWCGSTISSRQANYDSRTDYGAGERGEFRGITVAAGSLPANPWGLHEMHGNAWEYCADTWSPYPAGPLTDPLVQDDGRSSSPIARGGSFLSRPWRLRAAYRFRDGDSQHRTTGFRIAASIASK